MKTIVTTIILLISLVGKSQTSDILYIPSQKSLLLTYSSNFSPLGFYMGGYYRTTFPQPYIYTTPISIINRVGVNVTKDNKVSVMGGFFIENYSDGLKLQPDIWIKINPLRTILKTKNGFDLSLGINYMKNFRYGVGISIPMRGIYR